MIEVRMERGIGDGNNDGTAPTADEQQNHYASQASGNESFTNDSADRAPDKHRLICNGRDL